MLSAPLLVVVTCSCDPDVLKPYTSAEATDSNVGSAPLFARKNLPSLDDVPCGSLSKVTA